MTKVLEAVSKLIQRGWGQPKGAPRLRETGSSLRSTPATPSDLMVLKLLVFPHEIQKAAGLTSLLLILAMFAAWPTNVARAAGREFTIRENDLIVTIDWRWAGNSHGGYYPIRIRVVNKGPSRNLTFRFAPQNGSERVPTVQRTIGAEQNATVKFTLSVPMVGEGSTGRLSVVHEGIELKKFSRPIFLADVNRDNGGSPSLLVIAASHVDCSRFEQAVTSPTYLHTGGRSYSRGYPGGADHQVVSPNLLPESWIDYSGLDVVAISLASLSKLETDTRAAILKWVQCGGTLLVYKVGRLAQQSKELTRLLGFEDHRFVSPKWQLADPSKRRRILIDPEQLHSLEQLGPDFADSGFVWSGKPDSFVRRELMLGTVYAFEDNPFPGSAHDWSWLLQSIGPERTQWVKRHGITPRFSNDDFMKFLIPGVKGVPVFAFLVLITLFTIVIGPLNYFLLWKRKQLFLLVLTIPAIALVTSLSLFGYSAVAHGFGVKSRMRSFTVLDQKSRTAVTTSRIALYAGLAPSRGLRFSPDTAVFPIWPPFQKFESGRLDWTETQAFESGWLRSRTRTQFLTMTNRVERRRLEVEPPANGRLDVSNGFEWDIDGLVVADADGTLYVGRDLAAGASQQLRKAEQTDLDEMESLLERHPLKLPEGFEKGYSSSILNFNSRDQRKRYIIENTSHFSQSRMEREIAGLSTRLDRPRFSNKSYVAFFKENPGADLGIEETDEQAGFHVLVGYY